MEHTSKSSARRGWSLHLGRVAGIELRVHLSFFLLLAWVAWSDVAAGGGPRQVAEGLLLILCVFAIIVLHELAHALTARRFGVRTRDITLLPIGGVSNLEGMPKKPRQELLIALAGPSVNLILALILFGALALVHGPLGPGGPHLAGESFLAQLAWVNLGIGLFNLLPAFPMDGGRVLRAALALRMDHDRATRVAARLGQVVALGFAVVGIFSNPLLLFIALFVWVGAQQEAMMSQLHARLVGVPVERAMITQFLTLSPEDPLSRALALTLGGFQSEFPVIGEHGLCGVVTREAVKDGMHRLGPDAPVAAIMRREVGVVPSGTPVEAALGELNAAHGRAVVVTDHGAVVGMLTPESLAERVLVDPARSR